MKKYYLLLLLQIYLFSGCFHNQNLPNGWYYIKNNAKDTILGGPIVLVKDFELLTLDTLKMQDNSVTYEIVGKLKPGKINDFADATEKSIGKPIAFLYNGTIICTPSPNMRIDGGFFSITSLKYLSDKEKAILLFDDLKKEMAR